ncbi:MAG: type II toxin-antitoxin system RelE/ParE family toxin [Terriglobus sp.]
MNFEIRPAAREDILQQYRYYLVEQKAEATAERFLSAVQQAIDQVCNHPQIGSRKLLSHSTLSNLRTWPVEGYPATRLYYLFDGKTVGILRVLHSKRDIDLLFE